MNKKQLRDLIRRILTEIGLYSEYAENLLMGTSAQESHLGEYIRQINGPALGIFQMEPATFRDIVKNFLSYRLDLAQKILEASGCREFKAEHLEYNVALAICMTRVHYLRVTESIPTTIEGYARYWKKHYNTSLGKGTESEFITNYKKFAL